MKFPFKKVGDSFSVDEYNAMCYLLTKQDYKENIFLENKSKAYKYGAYHLIDINSSIVQKNNGFIIRKPTLPIQINLGHKSPSADFYIELNIFKQKQVTNSNGITSIIYPYDVIENLDDFDQETKPQDIIYEKITLKADKINDSTSILNFIPSEYGLTTGDYFSAKATISMEYNDPIINITDGRPLDTNQILCHNFNDIKRAISYCEEGSSIFLRLKGDTTYTFTDKIVIDGKRHIYIEGGNAERGYHSILDGENIYRHFLVMPDSLLSVTNCKFYRGNANVVHGNSDLNKAGGAIEMRARYENIGDTNGLHVAYVDLNNCIFDSCTAERGGAIYNFRGKLDVHDCDFINCKATSTTNPQGAFGGAIHTTSIPVYNGASNQIAINKSNYSYARYPLSVINLEIRQTQNITYFTDGNFVLPELELIYNNQIYNTDVLQRTDQYNYSIRLPVTLSVGSTFYLRAKNFSIQPSLCTRLLQVTKTGNQMYVEMV